MFHVDPQLLAHLGFTPSTIDRILELLVATLRGEIVARSVPNGRIDAIATASLLCARFRLIRELDARPGFHRVVKAIKADRQASLTIPEGSWFQLEIGYIMHRVGGVAFEKMLAGLPRDVALEDSAIQIECKTFLIANTVKDIWDQQMRTFLEIKKSHPQGAWRIEVNRDLTDGRPLEELAELFKQTTADDLSHYPNGEAGFLIKPQELPPPIGDVSRAPTIALCGYEDRDVLRVPGSHIMDGRLTLDISGPFFDRYRRVEDALLTKRRQTAEGLINFIALDSREFTGDVERLPDQLLALCQMEDFSSVSGFILVDAAPKERGTVLGVRLLENPGATVPVPDTVRMAIVGQHEALVAPSSVNAPSGTPD